MTIGYVVRETDTSSIMSDPEAGRQRNKMPLFVTAASDRVALSR